MLARQLGLFGHEEPGFDPEFSNIQRIELAEDAWLELLPGFLSGHSRLFELLLASTRFHTDRRRMFEREVDVPRCHASLPADGPGHPVVGRLRAALARRYGEPFPRVSLALYRDGRDSVAFHGDYVARRLPTAHVASVSLGAPRRFLLRETSRRGRSLTLSLGTGDLLVMGGTCQRTHQHAIPKTAHASPRLTLMFRPHWVDPDAAATR